MASFTKCPSCLEAAINAVVQPRARSNFASIAHRRSTTRLLTTSYHTSVPKRLASSFNSPSTGIAHKNELATAKTSQESESKSSFTQPTSSDGPKTALPWYLQVHDAQKEGAVVSNRPELPALPKSPPPLLGASLEYLQFEQGISDLRIQDLRSLNPPSALGTNLVMVFGTARGEKHLHALSDRFCRWLRSNHDLSPVADGLLGRNELKIKLRRKARKARLLNSVGAIKNESEDDGIRTGWVCVNISNVPSAPSLGSNDTYRSTTQSSPEQTTIVVQLMTSEKREQIDLEGLWGSRSRNHSVEPMAAEMTGPGTNLSSSIADAISPSPFFSTRPAVPSSQSVVSKRQAHQYVGHLRAFHAQSSTRESLQANSNHEVYELNERADRDEEIYGISESELITAVANGNFSLVRQKLLGSSPESLDKLGLSTDDAKSLQMGALNAHLRSLPVNAAIKSLGKSNKDFASTQHLLSFFQLMPTFPTVDHLRERLSMVSYAVQIGHPGYDATELIHILRQIYNSTGIVDSEDIKSCIVASISGGETRDQEASAEIYRSLLPNHKAIFGLLELAQYPGMLSIDHRLLTESLQSLTPTNQASPVPAVPWSGPETQTSKADEIIEMFKHFGYSPSVDQKIELMHLYANMGHWTAFWNFWYREGQTSVDRDRNLFPHLFTIIANTGHIQACALVVREWGTFLITHFCGAYIAKSAMGICQCILVVDPQIEQKIQDDSNYMNEWTVPWNRMRKVVQTSRDREKEAQAQPQPLYEQAVRGQDLRRRGSRTRGGLQTSEGQGQGRDSQERAGLGSDGPNQDLRRVVIRGRSIEWHGLRGRILPRLAAPYRDIYLEEVRARGRGIERQSNPDQRGRGNNEGGPAVGSQPV